MQKACSVKPQRRPFDTPKTAKWYYPHKTGTQKAAKGHAVGIRNELKDPISTNPTDITDMTFCNAQPYTSLTKAKDTAPAQEGSWTGTQPRQIVNIH